MLVNNKYGAAPNADRVTNDETLLLCRLVRTACPMMRARATDSFCSGGVRGYEI